MKIFTKYLFFVLIFSLILSAQSNDAFKIGIIKYKTKDKLLATYKPFADYISRQINSPVTLDIVDSDELAYLLVNNKYDMGIFKPFAYLEAKNKFPELEPFATNKVYGSEIYSGAIIVKENSGINNLHQLKDKSFLFVKPTSTSGFRVPNSILQEYNIDIDSHFVKYDFTRSHRKSIEYLLLDSVDGISVDIEDLKDFSDAEKSNLKFLKRYDMPMHAYVLSPKLNKELKNKVKNAFYNAYRDPFADEIFSNPLGIEAWVKIDDEYYNPLRRYMRLVRIKPYAKITYDIAENAEESLNEKGDIMHIVKDNIENEIKDCKRFAKKIPNHENLDNFYHIKLSLSKLDEHYFYQIYLNNSRITTGELAQDEIISDLHSVTINSVLNSMDLQAGLINSQDNWFISYGANDGINEYDYDFLLENNEELKVDSVTEFNTFFQANPNFSEDDKVTVKYTKKGNELNYSGFDSKKGSSFWDNLDNVWGVIGILVAMITGLIGYLFIRYKHRRFTTILYKSNDLLKDFIEGKYKIETRLIEQIEFINTALEKGFVNENQFMILKNRIDDIQHIIENQNIKSKLTKPEIKDEINKILEDGVITEKEYSKLTTLLTKYKN